MFLMVNTVISNCLITIGMLGNCDFNPTTHRQTFDTVLWNLVTHFLHIALDINTLLAKHTIGPIGWDIPRIVQGFTQSHHTCTWTIYIHDRISIREFCRIIGQDTSASHQTLVNGNTVGQQRLGCRGWRTLGVKGVIVLVYLVITTTNET